MAISGSWVVDGLVKLLIVGGVVRCGSRFMVWRPGVQDSRSMIMAMPIPPPRSRSTFPPRASVLTGRLDRAGSP